MHMYCTAKVYIPEYFIDELSHIMLGMRVTISKDIQNRGGKFQEGKYPLSLPIYRWMYSIL